MQQQRQNPVVQEFVFILSTTKKPTEASAVSVKPCLPTSRLGSILGQYLREVWSVNAWEMLFLHLASTSQSEAEDKEVVDLVTRCENDLPFGATPMKKYARMVVH